MNLIQSNQNSLQLKLVLFISLILFHGCSEQHFYTNYKKMRKPDINIKLHSIVVNKFEIKYAGPLGIIGNLLIFIDKKEEYIIKIIDFKSGEVLKSFGRLGQGPGEFIGPSGIIYDPKNKNTFWIYDISMMRLQKFNLSKLLNNNFIPEKILNLSVEKNGYATQLIITSDDEILGIGFYLKGRVSIYNMNGDFLRSLGTIPVALKKERFAAHHSHGYTGNMVFLKKSKEVFLAIRFGSIVEKYNMDGKLISTFQGPDTFFPQYDIVQAGNGYTMTYNEKTRFGYLDIQYCEKLNRIFLLYSGKKQFVNEKDNQAYMGNIIYVMDTMGTITEQIELDKEIIKIGISDDGSEIIGLSETELLKFEYLNRPHRD